jgi:UDP-glucose 4-epimerase
MKDQNVLSLEETFTGKRVTVTGGLGFIGSNLAHRLVDLGAHVLIIDALIPGHGGHWQNIAGINGSVEIEIADLRNEDALSHLIHEQEYLFNLAGQVSHIDSMVDPKLDLELNVHAQLALLEACRQNNAGVRIIHTATRQQYGQPQRLPVDETHPLNPVDINGVHKTAGEMYFIIYHRVYGLRTTSLRLTNVYGPRQLISHNRQGFIGWFVRQIMCGEEIQVFGDGEQLRDMCYVDDVVGALLLAAAHECTVGEVYNVGGPHPVSLKKIVETLISLKGDGTYRLVPFPDERKRIDIKSFDTDTTKIRQQLGWKPIVDLQDGLATTIAYYRHHLEHYL